MLLVLLRRHAGAAEWNTLDRVVGVCGPGGCRPVRRLMRHSLGKLLPPVCSLSVSTSLGPIRLHLPREMLIPSIRLHVS